MVVGPGRLRRVGARALGRAGARPAGTGGSVRVRVWGEGAAEPSAWSEDVVVEAGLLDPADWTAQLVQPALPEPDAERAGAAAAPRVRARQAGRPGPAVRHRARRLRGRAERLGRRRSGARSGLDQLPTTGCATRPTTSPACSRGAQRASASSWPTAGTAATSGSPARANIYGDRTGAFLQLEVEHPDGTRTTVVSDGCWRSRRRAADRGPASTAARPSTPAASSPAGRRRVSTTAAGRRCEVGSLDVAHAGRPDRSAGAPHPRYCPSREITTSPSGKTLVDFGQNLVGRHPVARCPTGRPAPRSPSGTPRCSSTANSAPGRCGRPRRPTSSSSTGTGPRTWEPRFTFHGFRYAEVSGWPGELDRRRPRGRRACTPICGGPAPSPARTPT